MAIFAGFQVLQTTSICFPKFKLLTHVGGDVIVRLFPEIFAVGLRKQACDNQAERHQTCHDTEDGHVGGRRIDLSAAGTAVMREGRSLKPVHVLGTRGAMLLQVGGSQIVMRSVVVDCRVEGASDMWLPGKDGW